MCPKTRSYLMGPTDEVHVVFVEELCDDVSSESEGHTAVIFTPAQHIFIWVRPKQVAEEALVRHIGGTHDPSHLLHSLKIGGQACPRQIKTSKLHHPKLNQCCHPKGVCFTDDSHCNMLSDDSKGLLKY